MFCPNAVVCHQSSGDSMRFARHPALIAAFLALAVVGLAIAWPMIWPIFEPEVSRERLAVNGAVRQADLAPSQGRRFRCDSAVAQDCFEMFHRHESRQR